MRGTSGRPAVLRRMRRRWGSQRFVDRCRYVQERLCRPAITTDIIVGFPGETEEDFEATCAVAREVGFSKIHIFPYSPRRGTPAAEMPDQVPAPVKQERGRRLGDLESELRDEYLQSLAGRPLRVLVESVARQDPKYLTGTSCRYVPVDLPADQAAIGQFASVTVDAIVDGRVRMAAC